MHLVFLVKIWRLETCSLTDNESHETFIVCWMENHYLLFLLVEINQINKLVSLCYRLNKLLVSSRIIILSVPDLLWRLNVCQRWILNMYEDDEEEQGTGAEMCRIKASSLYWSVKTGWNDTAVSPSHWIFCKQRCQALLLSVPLHSPLWPPGFHLHRSWQWLGAAAPSPWPKLWPPGSQRKTQMLRLSIIANTKKVYAKISCLSEVRHSLLTTELNWRGASEWN